MKAEDFYVHPLSVVPIPYGFESVVKDPDSQLVLGFDFHWREHDDKLKACYVVRCMDLSLQFFGLVSGRLYQRLLRHFHQNGLRVAFRQSREPAHDRQISCDIFGPIGEDVSLDRCEAIRDFGAAMVTGLSADRCIRADIALCLQDAIKSFSFEGCYPPRRPVGQPDSRSFPRRAP